jgi:hypothetical protein
MESQFWCVHYASVYDEGDAECGAEIMYKILLAKRSELSLSSVIYIAADKFETSSLHQMVTTQPHVFALVKVAKATVADELHIHFKHAAKNSQSDYTFECRLWSFDALSAKQFLSAQAKHAANADIQIVATLL